MAVVAADKVPKEQVRAIISYDLASPYWEAGRGSSGIRSGRRRERPKTGGSPTTEAWLPAGPVQPHSKSLAEIRPLGYCRYPR